MKLIALTLVSILCSCNSTFVVKSKSGSEVAYTGSLGSKATLDKTKITMASGAMIDKEIHFKDEVEGAATIARLDLIKMAAGKGIDAVQETTSDAIKAVDQ